MDYSCLSWVKFYPNIISGQLFCNFHLILTLNEEKDLNPNSVSKCKLHSNVFPMILWQTLRIIAHRMRIRFRIGLSAVSDVLPNLEMCCFRQICHTKCDRLKRGIKLWESNVCSPFAIKKK